MSEEIVITETNYDENEYEEAVKEKKPTMVFSILSFISFILGLFGVCCTLGIATLPLMLASVIFTLISRRKRGKYDGLSIFGLIVGILALALIVIGIIAFVIFFIAYLGPNLEALIALTGLTGGI